MSVCQPQPSYVCGSWRSGGWHESSEDHRSRSGKTFSCLLSRVIYVLQMNLTRIYVEFVFQRTFVFHCFSLIRKLKLASGSDVCVQQLLKEEDLGYSLYANLIYFAIM